MVDLTFVQGHTRFSIQTQFDVVPSRPHNFKMTPATTGFFRFCNGRTHPCKQTSAFLYTNPRRCCAIKTSQRQNDPPDNRFFPVLRRAISSVCEDTGISLFKHSSALCHQDLAKSNDPPDNRFFPVLQWAILHLCKDTRVSLYTTISALCHQDLAISK